MDTDNNIIITNNCDQKTKLRYIKDNISPNFNLSLFFCIGIHNNNIIDWIDKGYLPPVPKKMIAFNDESSMLLEPFTIGGSYIWQNKTYDWISLHNQTFDTIIVDRFADLLLTIKEIKFFRDTWWRIKPLYIFSDKTKEQMQEFCKDANIDANIIEL